MEESIATSIILPLSLAIIMLGMGLSLTVNDFKNVLAFPKAALLGFVNQLVLLPLIGFALAILFNLPPEMAVGLILLTACPGGATSNLITHVSKGDSALSITLTAFSSLITVITIPIVVSLAIINFTANSDLEVQLPILKTIIQIMGITIIPVIAGMVLRRFRKNFAVGMEKPVRIASIVILIVVIIGVVGSKHAEIVPYFKSAGLVTILLNITAMLVGYISAKILKLNLKQTITITVETGVQNAVLAMVIAASILKQPNMAIPAAVYSIVMLFTGGFVMWYFGRRNLDNNVY